MRHSWDCRSAKSARLTFASRRFFSSVSFAPPAASAMFFAISTSKAARFPRSSLRPFSSSILGRISFASSNARVGSVIPFGAIQLRQRDASLGPGSVLAGRKDLQKIQISILGVGIILLIPEFIRALNQFIFGPSTQHPIQTAAGQDQDGDDSEEAVNLERIPNVLLFRRFGPLPLRASRCSALRRHPCQRSATGRRSHLRRRAGKKRHPTGCGSANASATSGSSSARSMTSSDLLRGGPQRCVTGLVVFTGAQFSDQLGCLKSGELAVVDQQFRDRFGRDTRAAGLELFSEGLDDLLVEQPESLDSIDQFIRKHRKRLKGFR